MHVLGDLFKGLLSPIVFLGSSKAWEVFHSFPSTGLVEVAFSFYLDLV